MDKKNKREITITPSGHEADRDLSRVPIKVFPSLQALIANQVELIDIIEGKAPPNSIFVEQHKLEMIQVEETIAEAFSNHAKKKEQAREKRLMKKTAVEEPVGKPPWDEQEPVPALKPATKFESYSAEESAPPEKQFSDKGDFPSSKLDISFSTFTEESLNSVEPKGLPSAKYRERTPAEETKREVDVRRVVLGASIKTLQSFLGRKLSEEEMRSLETQVDSYLE